MKKLIDYDLDDALIEFEKSLEIEPRDPEVYFHMACAYSILERTEDGFEALRKSVAFGLKNTEEILNHDMLAFIRLNKAFGAFVNSGFEKYNIDLLADGDIESV